MDGDSIKQDSLSIPIKGSNGYDVVISLLVLSTFWLRWLIRSHNEMDRILLDH